MSNLRCTATSGFVEQRKSLLARARRSILKEVASRASDWQTLLSRVGSSAYFPYQGCTQSISSQNYRSRTQSHCIRILCRLFRAGISICLLKSGLQAVLRTVAGSLHQRDNNIIYDATVEEYFASSHFASRPCVESKIDSLSITQRFLLRRLEFSDELLCAELGIPAENIESTKQELLSVLEVGDVQDAIRFAELYEVTQLRLEPDENENLNLKRESIAVISSWLEKSLTNSKPWRS